ncbi:MAG TPA: LysM peptidoglycan-binding domain-containing protein [Verrucomicrobiae bacterium]
MSKWPASWRVILLFVFCCLLSGCLPVSDTPADDEKDPNYIEGRNHYNMMDWKGAVEAYERAVQANPRNAAAHFELGVLYQERLKDPVTAAFHYQKHLELRPNSPYREVIRPKLEACKMEIAKTVTFVVVNQEVHKDLARLTNELNVAKKEIDALHGQLAATPRVITQWMKFTVTNYFTNYVQVASAQSFAQQPRTTNTQQRLPPTSTVSSNTTHRTTLPPSGPVMRADIRPPAAVSSTPKVRTYTVRPGETMAEVARKFGVSLPKLQAANPTIQPRQMKAGQTLNIPSQ